jgi:NAD-dependent SIR2 family protein deacetylase
MPNNRLKDAKKAIDNCDAILIVAGAGMSVDSGIFTYRGRNGIWGKSIKVGNQNYRYTEISSLETWKNNPELAWGFKANFYKMMKNNNPHEGYYTLLEYIKNKKNNNYFVCTSNIDNYFERAGFDKDKIYEAHGNMVRYQCMDKKCTSIHGLFTDKEIQLPPFDEETFIAHNLPKCPNCPNILRPNVSMFGDYNYYEKPYDYIKKRMLNWLNELNEKNKKLVILEIGCGINPHSIRMCDNIPMSKEYKLPKVKKCVYIRLNPEDEEKKKQEVLHINMGAKAGLKSLLS